MKIWAITWRYLDGSSSGVMDAAYEDYAFASHVASMLEKEPTMKEYRLVEMTVMESAARNGVLRPWMRQNPKDGTPLWELALTIRSAKILRSEGIETIDQLLLCKESDLMKMPGMGRKSIDDIKQSLSQRGMRLA